MSLVCPHQPMNPVSDDKKLLSSWSFKYFMVIPSKDQLDSKSFSRLQVFHSYLYHGWIVTHGHTELLSEVDWNELKWISLTPIQPCTPVSCVHAFFLSFVYVCACFISQWYWKVYDRRHLVSYIFTSSAFPNTVPCT